MPPLTQQKRMDAAHPETLRNDINGTLPNHSEIFRLRPASYLTSEYMCGKNIAITLVPYSSFPFPHLWTGTRSFFSY